MGLTVNLQYNGELRTTVTHVRSNSELVTDAPIDNKGLGSTFSPTDLTATSLVSCMITVMGIKANTNDIDFTNIKATCEKIMASNPRRISQLKTVIFVNHQWDTKEKALLEATAKSCPVALSLHPDIKQELSFVYG